MKRKFYPLLTTSMILALFLSTLVAGAQKISADSQNGERTAIACNLTLSLNPTNVSCFGDADGIIEATWSGQTGPIDIYLNDVLVEEEVTSPYYIYDLPAAENYSVKIVDQADPDCDRTESVSITQPDQVAITAEGTDVSCYGEDDGYIQVLTTNGTRHELWLNGEKIADGPDGNLQYTGLAPGTTYVVKAFADGNQDAECMGETPAITIQEPPLLECEITSFQNASCATCADGSATVVPIGGTPDYDYLWSDGQTTATATNLEAGDYTVTITDANGCTSTCEVTIGYEESEENCTLTQGFYGNEGGLFCDEITTTDLLNSLLTEPLVIGVAGSGSLTVGVGESDFVLMMLPGGGGSSVLTADYNYSNYLTQTPQIWKKKNLTLTNSLLAQTLTLGLNLRIDGSTLSGLPINSMELVVYNITECGGEAIGDPIYYDLNESVYDELVAKYGNPTVGDLLEMANLSLADDYVPALYQPSLSDISDAVTMINEAFDECRIGSFSPPGDRSSDELTGIINTEENASISAYPNPFIDKVTIEFTVTEDSDAILEVYNMTGAKVASLYNGHVQANQTYSFNFNGISHVNQGTFIYVLRTGKTVKMGRLVMMK